MVYEEEKTIRLIKQKISIAELKQIAQERFGDLVKAVVDVKNGFMAVGGELHADEESVLLQRGSNQNDLWGINLYPDKSFDEMIEFDSMINIRPRQGNRSRGIEDAVIRENIIKAVRSLVE